VVERISPPNTHDPLQFGYQRLRRSGK